MSPCRRIRICTLHIIGIAIVVVCPLRDNEYSLTDFDISLLTLLKISLIFLSFFRNKISFFEGLKKKTVSNFFRTLSENRQVIYKKYILRFCLKSKKCKKFHLQNDSKHANTPKKVREKFGKRLETVRE